MLIRALRAPAPARRLELNRILASFRQIGECRLVAGPKRRRPTAPVEGENETAA